MNTTITSALSHTYVVSGAANFCCADICWGNNLVSRRRLGFFAWKATTLALIHLWRVPLLSLHKSKEKTTQIFSLAPANFQSSRRGSKKLWGSIGSAPDYRWNPGGHFAGALKMNIKTIFGLNCIRAFATLVKDKAAFFNVYSYLPSKHSQVYNHCILVKCIVIQNSRWTAIQKEFNLLVRAFHQKLNELGIKMACLELGICCLFGA